MINHVYQLVSPKAFSIKFEDTFIENKVVVKPLYMSICHADQRYYQGNRPSDVLRKKLPMALIHETCGQVILDKSGTFQHGDKVVLIPNHPSAADNTGTSQIYENYRSGSYFLSSGYDGFMRETVAIDPDRVVGIGDVDPLVASISEFVSVCVHAIGRLDKIAHDERGIIGVWGDGSLSYCLCVMLKQLMPSSKIAVIGMNMQKLNMFSFVDFKYLANEIPIDFTCDHAFECAGGEGSTFAIDDMIRYIMPQGSMVLMGVSENKVPIYTRNVLEKGLSIVGCSRSGREDFLKVSDVLINNKQVSNRLIRIITKLNDVKDVDGIHRAFSEDLVVPFKSTFAWKL